MKKDDSKKDINLSGPASAREPDRQKEGQPCRNTVIAIRCLQLCFLVILAMELIMVTMALSSDRGSVGQSEYTGAPETVVVIMFLILLPTTYGLRRKSVGAWFMAILEFALYMFFGFAGLSGSGVCGMLVLLLPIGVVGIVNLFARSCRKEFDVG